MRTRIRDTVVTQPGSFDSSVAVTETAVAYRYFRPTGQWCTGVGSYQLNPFPDAGALFPSKIGVEESISDENTSPGSDHSCYHTKLVWNCPLKTVEVKGRLFKAPSSYPEGLVTTRVTLGASLAVATGLVQDPTALTVLRSVDFLTRDARWSAHPKRMGGEVNLLQEVGEMIEFGKSLKGLRNRLDQIKASKQRHHGSSVKRLFDDVYDAVFGRNRDPSLGDAVRLASQLRLTKQLGIDPFLSTAQRFAKALESMKRKCARLAGAEMHRLHGVARDRVTWTRVGRDGYHGSESESSLVRGVHTTLNVSYTSGRTRALEEKIGDAVYGRTRRHILVGAWELVPWSFVLDMFVDVGSYLADWANTPIEGIEVTIHSATESLKETLTVEGRHLVFKAGTELDDYSASGPDQFATGSAQQVVYNRYLVPVNNIDLADVPPARIKLRLPNPGQFLTLLDLVIVRT